MPDHLSTKEWKAVLDKKEHKTVKKTGVSETLDDYASAVKKKDRGLKVSALERIIEKATEVKSAQSRFPLIVSFLTETIKEAKAAEQKLALEVEALAKEGGGENEDSTLGKVLARVKQVDAEGAWYFVLVAGKPSSGFVVTKKETKKADIEQAFEMKGKRGPYFTGRIFFDAAKYVLDLGPEIKPIPGLAKAAKNAALLHAEMSIKVVLRGGGVEIDADRDIEPTEEGGGTLGSAPEGTEDRRPVYEGKIEQLKKAIGLFQKSPNARVPGAADGLYGAISLLLNQIRDDERLGQSKVDFTNRVTGLRLILDDIAKPDAPTTPPPSKYPDEAYWARLAEGIMRLDPVKQQDGWKRYQARGQEVEQQFRADKSLVEPERSRVWATIERALALGTQATNATNRMNKREEKDPLMAEVFLRLERKYDIIKTTPGMDPAQVQRIEEFFATFRKSFREGSLNLVDPKIGQLEQVLDRLSGRALALRQEQSRVDGQKQMHENVSKALPFLKKASVPVGLVKDPETIRSEMAGNPNLRLMLESMSKAAKTPGGQNGKEMENAARTYLGQSRSRFDAERIEWKRDQENKGTYLPYPEPPLTPTEALGADVLRRAQMMQLAEALEGLPPPPWDQKTSDRASQLQSELFFIESSIQSGEATYEAPALGEGSKGTSGSWWIERPETGGDGKVLKKKYIFKPATLEDGIIAGVPKGSGAPREVMAKRLDDTMSGAGFSVGVSPTTLVNIDSTNLGTRKPDGGPLLGSMQQLAPSDGSLMEHLNNKTLGTLSGTIDKRNFDDIAAFDMIYGNVDRHAGNLLFRLDPETGRNVIVPIDHGAGLLPPDDLQTNMTSLLSGRNILANPSLTQSQEPMGAETLEALERLNPDDLVDQMKTSRNDIADGHPQTRGTISDEAIEAMGARVRFLKVAAKEVPVGLLFQMLALGAKRIAIARPEEIPALVKTLRQEALDLEEAMAAKTEVLDGLERGGMTQSMNILSSDLQSLGWAWNLVASDIDEWVARNGKLVTRILKTRMVNPALQREIDRLLPAARQINPQIDTKIAGRKPVDVYKEVYTAAHMKIADPIGADVPTATLTREFDQLGGQGAWDAAAKVFPDIESGMDQPRNTEEAEQSYWARRVMFLRQWQAFKDKGGVAEVIRLGGTLPREFKILSAIKLIDELSASEDVREDLLAMDDEEVENGTDDIYGDMLERGTDMISRMRSESERKRCEKLHEAAITEWSNDRKLSAMTLIANAVRIAAPQIETERKFDEEVDSFIEEMREAVRTGDEKVKQQFEGVLDGLIKRAEATKVNIGTGAKSSVVREFRTRLDIATTGDASEYRVLEKSIEATELRIAGHAGYPWHQALVSKVSGVREVLTKFEISNVTSMSKFLNESLDAVDLIKAALVRVDLRNLPQAVTEIIAPLPNLISTNSRCDGPDRADRIRKALGV